MLNFQINPSSGHAESCLDIQFAVKVDKADVLEINIFNDSAKEQLDILSINKGVIQEEKTIIAKNTNSIDGFINLFNKDKMNTRLADLVKVDLRCVAKMQVGDQISTEESSTVFYNESQSLDAHIIPFDFVLDNNIIDLKNNVPIGINIVCDNENKFELAIRSDDGQSLCTFDVVVHKGHNTIQLPSEIAWHDLQISKYYMKKFQFYWVKFEGVNHMKFMNRKYVPIPGSTISFNSTAMHPKPQTRLGPTGAELPKDFVLSHRYFVHTWKQYTSLGDIAEAAQIYSEPNVNKIRFIHEVQHLEQKKKLSMFAASQHQEVAKSISNVPATIYPDARQRMLLNSYTAAYTKKTPVPRTDRNYVKHVPQESRVQTASASHKKKGGCGCSRKKST